ncbi:BatD family protein [Galbibacter mesophilus]|uniref:BatD family protein n=1 Tax=Galbibacter mesophilus TaxID=379069 RepID=UPI00191FF3AC|nr:BatD family protein [Galbibacter mesophilus]MCM5664110.1 BatD family protein [Galbibacter mesophilus]
MRRAGKYISFLVLVCILLCSQFGVAQSVWSTVTANKKSVFVGEPVQVTVTVYTSTWFTKGLDLGNIKVEGAFSTYFRPVSTSFQRGGQNYAGVRLIYHVFPFSDDDIEFPALDIEVETPSPGGYKGIKRTVKSKPVAITVKPIPNTFKASEWLVASSLSVNENWSGNISEVKVGDVLERTITRNAGWTVAELIPPTVWDSVPNVSMYPGRSDVNNSKSKTAISAQRTETIRYLFEEEGEITIPEKVYTWFNPYSKKLFKRTLAERTITVKPNPDLGMLESVRDSLRLQQQQQVAATEDEEKELTILGLSPKEFVIALLLCLLALIIVFKMLKWLVHYFTEKRKAYLASEKYYFNHLLSSLSSNEHTIKNNFYRWIDELALEEPSIQFLINKYGKGLQIDAENLKATATKPKLKTLRKNYLKRTTEVARVGWINP